LVEGDFESSEEYEEAVEKQGEKLKKTKNKLLNDLRSRVRKINDRSKKGVAFGVTLNSFLSDQIVQEMHYETVVVDESIRGHIGEYLPILSILGVKKIIFIGDQKQLGNIPLDPHFVAQNNFSEEEIATFRKGPFYFLWENAKGIPRQMLKTNRRSGKKIVKLTSRMHYDDKLKCGRKEEGQVTFVDTRECKSEEQAIGTSYVDHREARELVYWAVGKLNQLMPAGETNRAKRIHRLRNALYENPRYLAIICSYKAQADLVRRKLRRKLWPMFIPEKSGNEKIDTRREAGAERAREEIIEKLLWPHIGTVDAFQGEEYESVGVSLGRTNPQGLIGHLAEEERMNVAITRPRDELHVVGNTSTLIHNNEDPESSAYFEKFVDTVREVGGEIIFLGQDGERRREQR